MRGVNDVLTVVVAIMCLYVLILPFWPLVQFRFKDKSVPFQITSQATNKAAAEPRPTDNRLLIPKLGMSEQIHLGGAESLSKGVWLRPNGSVPSSDSNTVVVGHRFTYSISEAVFYHLDKVAVNDLIALYWNNQEFNYKVREVKVVPATAIEIEEPTVEPILTLYTCTPIWSAKDRLVVVADLIYKETL